MGSHYRVGSVRRFAFGSPAVIESSPPMGASASRYAFGKRRIFSPCAAIDDCPPQLLFNTENRLFSRDCSVARKYAKIRNISFSKTSLLRAAAWTPKNANFATIWHVSGLFFHRKQALDREIHPLETEIHGMLRPKHPMDRLVRRTDAQKKRWKADLGGCPL